MTPNRFDVINDLGKVLVTIPEEYTPEHRAYLAQLFASSEELYNNAMKLRAAYQEGDFRDTAESLDAFVTYMDRLQRQVYFSKRRAREDAAAEAEDKKKAKKSSAKRKKK